jgi:cellulose synthase/poly-beta-1,6-N-acetylglucosamine synthase-like glycosyltransferase
MEQDSAIPETEAILDDSAGSGAPLISVVIPHYNDLDNLQLCLSRLARQPLPRSRFEIVVADNNSACGIEAVTELCGPDVKVIPAPIQGAAGARNAALEVARGAVYAFTDSDCRPALNWLEEGVKALETTDIVGGRVDVDFADPNRPNAIEAYEAVFAFDFRRYIEKEGFTGAGNMFVRRPTFERVGLFRSGVPEDKDWSQRAVAKGFDLKYCDGVVVTHPARRTWDELAKKSYRVVWEIYGLRSMNKPGAANWTIYCFMILLSPFVHSFKILFSKKIKGVRLKLAAIFVLFRLRWNRFSWFYEILLLNAERP